MGGEYVWGNQNGNNIKIFEIVKNFLINVIKERKHNPFNYRKIDMNKCYFYSLNKKEQNKYLEELKIENDNINKYHNYIHWFSLNNKLKKSDFLNQIDKFKYYTYAIIYNKIINDNLLKLKNGKFMSKLNPNYENNFSILLNNFKYIKIEEIKNGIELPNNYYLPNKKKHYFQDNLGNYILARIEQEFKINSFYNLSNYL